MGVRASPDLPRLLAGRLGGSMESAYSAWLEEMIADAVAAVMLGPAALRGLIHSLAAPNEPERVSRARTDDGEVFAPHPPAHLRVAWTARLLDRLGYAANARTLFEQWNVAHAEPSEIRLPVQGGFEASVPAQVLIEGGAALLEAWYAGRFASLAGFTIAEIPGFAMSPGLWARVRKHAASMLAGRPQHDAPRILLAAGMEAQARHPGPPERLAHTIGQAILGLESGERRLPDRHYAPRSGLADRAALTELRDALILRQVLRPRRAGSHRPPHAGAR